MSEPFRMPEPITVVLDLPFPPSVNAIWRRKREGGMYRSKEYMAWIKQADVHVMVHYPRRQTIHGPCEAEIYLNVEAGIGDADNRIKCLLDYAQRLRVLDNDKLVMQGRWAWAKPSMAPHGCRLILRELAG